jgi:hypothetical protein
MPKQVTETHAGGTSTIVTEIDGVRSTVTKPTIANVFIGDNLAKTAYRQHKIFNPATQAYVTVNMTGNQAQDAALLAAALVTTGTPTNSVISST